MSPRRVSVSRIVASLCVGLGWPGIAPAQEPAGLSPPPDRSAPGVASCTPDRCTHRSALARRRCKRHLQETVLGFPEEFERPPLGSQLYAVNKVQVGNGEAGLMVLRPYDFEPGTSLLNARGRRTLGSIAGRLPTTFHPVVVEPSARPSLDEDRRAAVLAALGRGPFPIPPGRVVIGDSGAFGMRGVESIVVHEGMLSRTAQAGPPIAAGSDTPTAFGQTGNP